MADARIYCKQCAAETNHTVVGCLAICAVEGCGHETRLKKAARLKPARDIWTGKEIIKGKEKRKCMVKTKLTDEQIEIIKTRRAAGEKVLALATEFGVATWDIYALGGSKKRVSKKKGMGIDMAELTGAKGQKARKPESQKARKQHPRLSSSAGGGFKDAIMRIVREAVKEEVAALDLDAFVQVSVAAALKEMLK